MSTTHKSKYLIDFSYGVRNNEMMCCVRLNEVEFKQDNTGKLCGVTATKTLSCKWVPMKDIEQRVSAKAISQQDDALGKAVRELYTRLVFHKRGDPDELD